MKRIKSFTLGVDQGEQVLFSDFQDDGDMWTGSGSRIVRKHVEFSQMYSAPPTVHVGLGMWDTDHRTHMRVDIYAENVTVTGFDIVFRTWSDTRIARARANWIAMGPLPDEDDWHLSE